MPKYCYRCENCEHEFEEHKLMSERDDPVTCSGCETTSIMMRIPQIQNIRRKSNIGNIVNQAIKEASQALKQQKEDQLKERE